MTDATREKLKAIRKKKPLQTAILTTLEYDSGFAQGEKAGYNQAIDEIIIMIDQNVCNNNIDLFWDVLINKLEALKR